MEDILSQRLALEQQAKQVGIAQHALCRRASRHPIAKLARTKVRQALHSAAGLLYCSMCELLSTFGWRPAVHGDAITWQVGADAGTDDMEQARWCRCACCCLQVDSQIAAIQSVQEQRLNSMPPSARQAYDDLVAEQTSLLAEAGRFEEEAAELGAALAAAEGELGRNGFKQRVLEVQVRVLHTAV